MKVQFHWDRKGRRDDTASAWVRLAQSWAGPSMGAVVTPRLGQEVPVRFLEGDPDRPVITGAVYDGQNPPPVALPFDRTRSTFKTDSSPDGQGGNHELRFEDQHGAEQVFLHGQKDELVAVENDKAQTVRGSEQLRVEKDRRRTVYTVNVVLGVNEAVGGARTVQVGGASLEAVGGARDERIEGDREAKAGGDLVTDVGSSHQASADGELRETVQGRSELEAEGPAAVQSREHFVEASRFTLVVGGMRILSIEPSGIVLLTGTSVTVNGERIALQGASIAKLGLAAAAAEQVAIARADELRAARALGTFTLVELDGQPIPHQPFELTPADGVVRRGRTSAEGKARVPLPEPGEYQLVFPRPAGEDRTEKTPKRGERARRDAQRIERGKKVRLATDEDHVLELPERVAMTIAFLFEPGRESEWPKFVLGPTSRTACAKGAWLERRRKPAAKE